MDASSIDLSKVVLETECEDCGGRGYQRNCDHCPKFRCSSCNGAGAIPTEFGEKVLRLMRNNFRSMLRDEMGQDNY